MSVLLRDGLRDNELPGVGVRAVGVVAERVGDDGIGEREVGGEISTVSRLSDCMTSVSTRSMLCGNSHEVMIHFSRYVSYMC